MKRADNNQGKFKNQNKKKKTLTQFRYRLQPVFLFPVSRHTEGNNPHTGQNTQTTKQRYEFKDEITDNYLPSYFFP